VKALTICQPYAHLIYLKEKRVENRTWPTRYRGRMYIHAGKSREWLSEGDMDRYPNMAFGAVIATAKLIDCLRFDLIQAGDYDTRYPWLRTHEHTNGPWCLILDSVCPIGPWPYRGAQGLFNIDDLDEVANKELGIPVEAQ